MLARQMHTGAAASSSALARRNGGKCVAAGARLGASLAATAGLAIQTPGRGSLGFLQTRAQQPRVRVQRNSGLQVMCMANQRRVQMVQKQLMRELSTMLLTDKRVRNTLLPEERLGADGSLSTLISVTDVRMSGDLQVAKVFISVFGPNGHGEDTAMTGLQKMEGYMRSQVGKAMGLQRVPELRFYLDDSQIRATKVSNILEQLEAERETSDGDGEGEGEEAADDDGVILIK